MRKAAVLGEKYSLSARGFEAQRRELDRSSASRAREKLNFGKLLSRIIERAELRVSRDNDVEWRCITLRAQSGKSPLDVLDAADCYDYDCDCHVAAKLISRPMAEQRSSTFQWLDELLQCPACAAAVSRTDDHYRCEVCARRFPIRFGIPDFRLLPDPYISIDDEIRKIESFTRRGRSFADAVKAYYDITPESPPELHSHYVAAMDEAVSRGAAILRKLRARFPETASHLALDLGCGTGGMSIAASSEYDQVIGVDVALRWLVMGKLRLAEEGVSLPFICANAESLPFRKEKFDVVVADAVLEHVQNSARLRDETLRVLKPRGAYFFTTNNRFSVLPEPHVRILGFGLLPRKLMEPVARRLRHTPYRARLYSRRELLRLFKGKGEVLLPSFAEGELGARHERVRKVWDYLRGNTLTRTILTPFVPQYFIAGQKEVI